MHLVKSKGWTGIHPIKKYKAFKREQKEEEPKSNVLTTVPESLTPDTEGRGLKKVRQELESVEAQKTNNKLKKFISLKI